MTDRQYKALILDLDGLVLDSESTYMAAWRQAAAELGCQLSSDMLREFSGLEGVEVERKLSQFLDGKFDFDRFQELSNHYWRQIVNEHGIPLQPGLLNLLKVLRELYIPYCLATNSRRQDARYCLELAGIGGLFPVLLARDDVQQGKPAPDIFRKAAATLAMDICECLVVEDSVIGVKAAVAAAAACLYVPSTQPPDSWAAEHALALYPDLHGVADFIQSNGIGS